MTHLLSYWWQGLDDRGDNPPKSESDTRKNLLLCIWNAYCTFRILHDLQFDVGNHGLPGKQPLIHGDVRT